MFLPYDSITTTLKVKLEMVAEKSKLKISIDNEETKSCQFQISNHGTYNHW